MPASSVYVISPVAVGSVAVVVSSCVKLVNVSFTSTAVAVEELWYSPILFVFPVVTSVYTPSSFVASASASFPLAHTVPVAVAVKT